MNGKMTRKVSTKPDAEGDDRETAFTVNFDGLSDDDAKAMIMAYLTVKRQGAWRRKGIPATETINAKDYAPGTRTVEVVSAENIAAKATTLSVDEQRKLLALLERMSQERNAA